MYSIALAPLTDPEIRVLQATLSTWTEFVRDLTAKGHIAYARLIEGQLPLEDDDDRVVRVTLAAEHARFLLRFAGLSA